MESFPFCDPLKRNIYPLKEITRYLKICDWQEFLLALSRNLNFFTFSPFFFPLQRLGGKGLYLCLFSSPHLGTSGNIAGFKAIGPCLRYWQHKAKLWAPGMQAVRLGCCHGNAVGCRRSRAPDSAHPFWAILKPPKEASQMLPCSFPAHNRKNCRQGNELGLQQHTHPSVTDCAAQRWDPLQLERVEWRAHFFLGW